MDQYETKVQDSEGKKMDFSRKKRQREKLLLKVIHQDADADELNVKRSRNKYFTDEKEDLTKLRGQNKKRKVKQGISNEQSEADKNGEQTFWSSFLSSNYLDSKIKEKICLSKKADFLSKTSLILKIGHNELNDICRFEDFESICVLGHGSCAVVEKQLFKPLKQEVAMKKYFNKRMIDEFDSEVYILQQKQAEYVPRLIYFNRERLSIFMELGLTTVDELDSQLIKQKKPFSDEFGTWMLHELLEINRDMYEEQFHHSDIKPDNIIFSFDENQMMKLKLIDFGAASIFEADYWNQFTPHFQCPELLAKMEGDDSLEDNTDYILSREEIFYAEFFASCRTVQLLTLSRHPRRTYLFALTSIQEYLQNSEVQAEFPFIHVILNYVFSKYQKSLDNQGYQFLRLLLTIGCNNQFYENYIETIQSPLK